MPGLPAADELHDLEMRSVGDRSRSPIFRLDDAAIQFDRDARRIEMQFLEQLLNGLSRRQLAALAIHERVYCVCFG